MTVESASGRYHHRRPLDQARYDRVRLAMHDARPRASAPLSREGVILDLQPSDILSITLIEGPQVVHLQAWNADDPDERIWTNETSSKEDGFLVRDRRIWGTMARFRPLLTVVEDSLTTAREEGRPVGPHHFVLGLAETPFTWKADGGDPVVVTAWDRFRALLAGRGLREADRDHISLFAKIVVDPVTQRLDPAPSEATAGDTIALFAEIPLTVALVPSVYRAGGRSAAGLDGSVAAVDWQISPVPVEPPGWPYPGVPYPDLAPYLGPDGHRA